HPIGDPVDAVPYIGTLHQCQLRDFSQKNDQKDRQNKHYERCHMRSLLNRRTGDALPMPSRRAESLMTAFPASQTVRNAHVKGDSGAGVTPTPFSFPLSG